MIYVWFHILDTAICYSSASNQGRAHALWLHNSSRFHVCFLHICQKSLVFIYSPLQFPQRKSPGNLLPYSVWLRAQKGHRWSKFLQFILFFFKCDWVHSHVWHSRCICRRSCRTLRTGSFRDNQASLWFISFFLLKATSIY